MIEAIKEVLEMSKFVQGEIPETKEGYQEKLWEAWSMGARYSSLSGKDNSNPVPRSPEDGPQLVQPNFGEGLNIAPKFPPPGGHQNEESDNHM